jgi:hypothetical protein
VRIVRGRPKGGETVSEMTWHDHVKAAARLVSELPHRSDWDIGPEGGIGFSIKDGVVTFRVTLPPERGSGSATVATPALFGSPGQNTVTFDGDKRLAPPEALS